jgi:hypothetical protein
MEMLLEETLNLRPGLTYFSKSPQQVNETRESWRDIDIFTSAFAVAGCVAFYMIF